MRTTTILVALLVGFADVARAQNDTFDLFGWLPRENSLNAEAVPDYVHLPEEVPTSRILPEDIIQDSIQLLPLSTNRFVVRWSYTEAGAKKMLAFREAYEGEKVRITIGSFESTPSEWKFHPMPPAFTNYAQWKEGWRTRRRDKVFGVSEDEARKIVAGLKGK